jgi:DNA-binding PadR family transcriptional regulator
MRYIYKNDMSVSAKQSVPAPECPEGLLPLTPAVFHILLALADGERHGYAIMTEVSQTTGGQIRMGPGTLYGTIKRLLVQGMIVECAERPDPALDDERRRYYRLTDWGRRVAQAEAQRYAATASAARRRKLIGNPAPGHNPV